MSGGHLFQWMRAVDEVGRADHLSEARPALHAIKLVAYHRVLFADPDGTNCFPAQTTLANLAQIRRTTVREVDTWLVAKGLMRLERRQAKGRAEYQLTIPDGAVRDHLPDLDGADGNHLNGSDGSSGNHLEGSADGSDGNHLGLDGSADGSGRTHNLLLEEEEEEGGARAADAARRPPHPDLHATIDSILWNTNQNIVVDDLEAPVGALLERGWPRWAITVKAKEILLKSDGRNPGRYLAGGLKRCDTRTLPAWVQVAAAYTRLADFVDELAAAGVPEGERDYFDQYYGTYDVNRLLNGGAVNPDDWGNPYQRMLSLGPMHLRRAHVRCQELIEAAPNHVRLYIERHQERVAAAKEEVAQARLGAAARNAQLQESTPF